MGRISAFCCCRERSFSRLIIICLLSFAVAMALHAVLEIVDSLFTMLVCNIGERVFMAVITGIFFVIPVIGMAYFAIYPVITVESEIPAMVKCCRFPTCSAMAGSAACLRLAVHIVSGLISLVATDALFST